MMKQALALVGAVGIAFGALQAAQAEDKPLKIMESVPGLTFPFFVHMMNQMKAEAEKLGGITVIESDGQVSSPKQTADIEAAITQGRQRHRHQPERGRRHGAGPAGSRRRQASRSSPSTAGSTRCRASSPMSAPTTSRAARRRASWS